MVLHIICYNTFFCCFYFCTYYCTVRAKILCKEGTNTKMRINDAKHTPAKIIQITDQNIKKFLYQVEDSPIDHLGGSCRKIEFYYYRRRKWFKSSISFANDSRTIGLLYKGGLLVS